MTGQNTEPLEPSQCTNYQQPSSTQHGQEYCPLLHSKTPFFPTSYLLTSECMASSQTRCPSVVIAGATPLLNWSPAPVRGPEHHKESPGVRAPRVSAAEGRGSPLEQHLCSVQPLNGFDEAGNEGSAPTVGPMKATTCVPGRQRWAGGVNPVGAGPTPT